MVDTLLILDPAHGSDTPGKRSPDGRLQEWRWSRDRISSIFYDLEQAAKGFDVAVPFLSFENEPGLRTRVDNYNTYVDKYPRTIMMSLHVDAFGDGTKWTDPSGFTIFTSRGETDADDYATTMGLALKQQLPNERWRFDFGLGPGETKKDLDREANFTVITGYKNQGTWVKTKYAGILIENTFMTNRNDVKGLLNPEWNQALERAYFNAIMKLMADLDRAPEFYKTIRK